MNIKNSLDNATRQLLIGSIMKQSGNFLPLTIREKTMIKWFAKLVVVLILVISSWFIPVRATIGFISHVNELEAQVIENSQKTLPVGQEFKKKAISESIKAYEIVSSTIRTVSAYNVGDIYQTDLFPCISANGENICLALKKGYNRCAANFVPFGSQLRISTPDMNWSFHCTVTDRMNSRYPNRVDIAMRLDEHQRALNFGLQNLLVDILK